MPRHDFECVDCGAVRRDVYRTFAEAESTYEVCECGSPMRQAFTPTTDISIPQKFRTPIRWDDVHSESPAELARRGDVDTVGAMRSQGHARDREAELAPAIHGAYQEALIQEERRFDDGSGV